MVGGRDSVLLRMLIAGLWAVLWCRRWALHLLCLCCWHVSSLALSARAQLIDANLAEALFEHSLGSVSFARPCSQPIMPTTLIVSLRS